MFGLSRLALIVLVCGCAYVAAPFYTAWSVREAAKLGDVAYLKDKVDWVAIRPGLKDSLTRLANSGDKTNVGSVASQPPGLWGRMKAAATRFFVHNFVDRYANAQGFETLVTYGRQVRDVELDDSKLSLSERVSKVWSRVRRAEFKSLTRFELDLVDKDDGQRLYAGVLELRGLQWIVTDLRIRVLPPAQVAQLFATN